MAVQSISFFINLLTGVMAILLIRQRRTLKRILLRIRAARGKKEQEKKSSSINILQQLDKEISGWQEDRSIETEQSNKLETKAVSTA